MIHCFDIILLIKKEGRIVLSRIIEYQKAYEEALNNFKNTSDVLAVIVYGSIVTGDIWDESDIDFLVITSEEDKMETLYSKSQNIYMHIKYISKNVFLENFKNTLMGGTFHKAFSSGKLSYCIDKEIEAVFHSSRFYTDADRKIRNIDILSEILNLMHYAKKFYSTKRYETAYELTVLVFKNYARIKMSMKGYITDKDIISIAINISEEVENTFNILVGEGEIKERIDKTLNIVQVFIEKNISEITIPIYNIVKESNMPLSIMDIESREELKCINKDLSLVVHEMAKNDIIYEDIREYKTKGNEFLVNEIVYSIKCNGGR